MKAFEITRQEVDEEKKKIDNGEACPRCDTTKKEREDKVKEVEDKKTEYENKVKEEHDLKEQAIGNRERMPQLTEELNEWEDKIK